MKINELGSLLAQEGFSPSVYSLDGGMPGYEGYSLSRRGNEWLLEYYERGGRWPERTFSTEEEACLYVYKMLHKHFQNYRNSKLGP